MSAICPYCISEINEKAIVCSHCGREVQLVFSLMKEIKQLKAHAHNDQNRAAIDTPRLAKSKKRYSFSTLLLTYLIIITSVTLLLFLKMPTTIGNSRFFYFQIAGVILNALSAWYIIKLAKYSNLLILLAYSVFPCLLLNIVYEKLDEQYINIFFVPALWYLAIINVALSFIIGTLSYIKYNNSLKSFFSFNFFIKYFLDWNEKSENIQKIVSMLGTILAFIYTIYNKI